MSCICSQCKIYIYIICRQIILNVLHINYPTHYWILLFVLFFLGFMRYTNEKNRCQIIFCQLIECLDMKTAEKGDGLIVTPSWCVSGN